MSDFQKMMIKFGVIGVVSLIALAIFYPFVTIGSGERGIVFSQRSGVQKEPLKEGLHFKMPIVEDVTVVNIQSKKVGFGVEDKDIVSRPVLGAASSDLQDVYVSLVVTYSPNPDKVPELYQKVGSDYEAKKVIPMVIDTVKTHTAKFKVEEILKNREKIRAAVLEDLLKKFSDENLVLETVSLTNFDFNPDYKKSIEARQVEEQLKATAQVTLEKMTIEAQQKVALAKAESEAAIASAEGLKKAKILEGESIQEYNKLIQQQVTPQVLEYKKLENQKNAIDKWDGKYPSTYMGNASGIPLINIKE